MKNWSGILVFAKTVKPNDARVSRSNAREKWSFCFVAFIFKYTIEERLRLDFRGQV